MEKFTKKQPISSLREGDLVDDVFVVKIKKGFSSYVKGFRFNLLVSDSSGKTLEYIYWGSNDESAVKKLYDSISSDSIVHIQGKYTIYNEKPQLATNSPFKIEVLSKEQYNSSDFIRPSKKDTEKLYREITSAISSVSDSHIKLLLETIFLNSEFAEKFKNHPGAIEIHHNWIGGLLEHTIEVLKYSLLSYEQFPSLNRDLLIAGALLHDIGKLEELDVTSRIKASNHGQLTGHLILGIVYVSQKIDEIPNFDKNLKDKILHILTSHHGKNEYGSPKEPMFPEAVAVHYADELSSKLSEMTEFIESAKQETEDNFMYSKRRNGNIFLK